jgi:hypothetical protein
VTRTEAEAYVRSCGETEGLDGDDDLLVELFRALYDRDPDDEDGDLWSLICAAADPMQDEVQP